MSCEHLLGGIVAPIWSFTTSLLLISHLCVVRCISKKRFCDLEITIITHNILLLLCAALCRRLLATSQHQHKLSSAIEKAGFLSSLDGASTVDKARLLAISAPQAHAWLRAQPSPKLRLDLLPNEIQALVKWWLGLPLMQMPAHIAPKP